MLRHLARDTGSQFVLFSMLPTMDIASLVMTCTRWSQWINEPRVLGPRHRAVKPSRFDELMQCAWIRQPQIDLQLLPEPTPAGGHDASSLSKHAQELESALPSVGPAFFPLLENLRIHTHVSCVRERILRDCFCSLAPRLRLLECKLETAEVKPRSSSLLHSLMEHVVLLPRLRVLIVEAKISAPHLMSFDSLPSLPLLEEFSFHSADPIAAVWRATEEQVACLARCNNLTELACGAWDADPQTSFEEQEAALRRRIGVLAAAKCARAGVDAAESFSPLTNLNLQTTIISPSLWAYLACLTELTEIAPIAWTGDPSVEQWAQLASFTRLRALSVTPPSNQILLLGRQRFLPALMQCVGLQVLHMSWTDLPLAQFSSLTAALRQLWWLDFAFVRFPAECFPLLSSLPLLSYLGITSYSTPDHTFLPVRPLIPALPALTRLRIDDAFEHRLTCDDVAADNAALFLRCPLLKPTQFQQNLC